MFGFLLDSIVRNVGAVVDVVAPPYKGASVMRKSQFDSDLYNDWEGQGEPDELQCKRCGSTDVRWRQQGGKWVLFSLEPGKLHVCPLSGDNFGVVEEK